MPPLTISPAPGTQSRVYRAEAVVLKGYDYGEADRILTLYTPQAGKLRAIAKGMRKTKSRLGGHLDLFTRSTLLIARRRQLDIVTQAETIDAFRPLREDLSRLSYAHYVAELVDGFSAEDLGNAALYDLLLLTLHRVASHPRPDIAVRSFEMRLLDVTGFRPQLHRCLQCETAIEPEVNTFSVKLGGVLCPHCRFADSAAPPISVNALKLLRNLQRDETPVLGLSDLPAELGDEVERRLQEYITYRLEARPRSVSFLDRLRSESAPN